MTKQQIIQTVEDNLDNAIKSFKSSIQELDGTADVDENETLSLDDFSQQDESTEMKHHLQAQLEKAITEKNNLERIKDIKCSEVTNGAMVETAKHYFLIGISSHGQNLKGKEVVGISLDAPVYPEWKGKKTGDQVKLGSEEITILDIQ